MIIEIAGLPRSGKTTAINAAKDYFLRAGFQTRPEVEGALLSPIPRKHRIEFACWIANRILNILLERSLTLPSSFLTILDRGLFDALVFFKLLEIQGFISSERLDGFMGYFGDERWAGLIDLVILFKVDPDIALQRDIASQLGPYPALVTNKPALEELMIAYEYVYKNFGSMFPKITIIETSDKHVKAVAGCLVSEIEDLIGKHSENPMG